LVGRLLVHFKIKVMDKLEKYYNLKFANDGKKPVFSVLSPDEKAKITYIVGTYAPKQGKFMRTVKEAELYLRTGRGETLKIKNAARLENGLSYLYEKEKTEVYHPNAAELFNKKGEYMGIVQYSTMFDVTGEIRVPNSWSASACEV